MSFGRLEILSTLPGVTLRQLNEIAPDEFLELQAQARVVRRMRIRDMAAAIRKALAKEQ